MALRFIVIIVITHIKVSNQYNGHKSDHFEFVTVEIYRAHPSLNLIILFYSRPITWSRLQHSFPDIMHIKGNNDR